MRIGVMPEGLVDRIKLHNSEFPRPLFDVMGMMLMSRAVMAGVHFRVFDRLASGARTPAELAKEIGCPEHGLQLLLDALVTCDYLKRQGRRYGNAPLARRWLLSESPRTLVNFVRYNYDQWEWTSKLETYLQSGEARDIHENLGEAEWRNYLLGLRDIATLSADELVSRIKLPQPPRSLLDVGGGHCHYSIAMCRRHPALQARVVDLEPAIRIGRELVAEAGLSQRIEFSAGDLLQAELGQNHDLAFLFNVVHHLDVATNRAAFRRLHAALAPQGKLIVWESFREEREKQQKDQLGSLLGLFFGLISRRQAYEFEQVAGWARAAGFKTIRRRVLRTAPFAALLVARK